MAATVLNSPRAIEMSIFVVRAFVRLRELLRANRQLAKRLDALEAQIARKLGSHDRTIASILDTLRRLTREDADRHRPMGFTADLDDTR